MAQEPGAAALKTRRRPHPAPLGWSPFPRRAGAGPARPRSGRFLASRGPGPQAKQTRTHPRPPPGSRREPEPGRALPSPAPRTGLPRVTAVRGGHAPLPGAPRSPRPRPTHLAQRRCSPAGPPRPSRGAVRELEWTTDPRARPRGGPTHRHLTRSPRDNGRQAGPRSGDEASEPPWSLKYRRGRPAGGAGEASQGAARPGAALAQGGAGRAAGGRGSRCAQVRVGPRTLAGHLRLCRLQHQPSPPAAPAGRGSRKFSTRRHLRVRLFPSSQDSKAPRGTCTRSRHWGLYWTVRAEMKKEQGPRRTSVSTHSRSESSGYFTLNEWETPSAFREPSRAVTGLLRRL